MNIKTAIVVVATALAFTGCATQVKMKPEVRTKVRQSDVVFEVEQRAIDAEINKSQMASLFGGALFALVDAAMDNASNNRATTRVGPYRDALLDYDFEEKLKNAVDQNLNTVPWFSTSAMEIERAVDAKQRAQRLQRSSADSVLFVKARYFMAPDFKSVVVRVSAELRPTKSGSAAPLYRQEFESVQASPVTSAEQAPDAVWTQQGGAALRTALDAAIADVASQIADDIDGRRAARPVALR